MKKSILLAIVITTLCLYVKIADARSGCCSSHGGVCGCGCCDGSGLSATCAPYYPWCNSSGSTTSTTPTTLTIPKPVTYELDGKTYTSKSAYDQAVREKFEREHKANITSTFKEILERTPTDDEVDYWYNYSDDLVEIKNALLATDEFKQLLFTKEHKENIRNVYIEIIGKQPTDSEINQLYLKSSDINIIKKYLEENKNNIINANTNINANANMDNKIESSPGGFFHNFLTKLITINICIYILGFILILDYLNKHKKRNN